MTQQIVTRSQFAKLAGVSPAAVTKACHTYLSVACVGGRIDAAHPIAVAYVQKQQGVETQPGLDPIYNDCLGWCSATGHWTATALRSQFQIGSVRANEIIELMRLSGALPRHDRADDTPHNEPATGAASLVAGVEPIDAANPIAASGAPVFTPNATPPSLVPTVAPTPVHLGGNGRGVALTSGEMYEAKIRFGIPEDADIPPEALEDIKVFLDMTLRDVVERFGTAQSFADWLKATREIEQIRERRLKNAKEEGKLVTRALVESGVIDPIEKALVKMLRDGSKTMAVRAMAMAQGGRSEDEVQHMIVNTLSSHIKPMKATVTRMLASAG